MRENNVSTYGSGTWARRTTNGQEWRSTVSRTPPTGCGQLTTTDKSNGARGLQELTGGIPMLSSGWKKMISMLLMHLQLIRDHRTTGIRNIGASGCVYRKPSVTDEWM